MIPLCVYSLYYCSTFTEMYIYCTCSIIMKLVSPILFYNIYNDCVNNDTNYRLLVCVCVYSFDFCL